MLEILSSELIGSMWNSMKNERHLKPIASWKRSNVYAKTCKNAESRENRRKPSMNTSQKSTKNRARPASTLQNYALNRAARTIQITKINAFGTNSPRGSGQSRVQKLRNLWKSVKIAENPRWVPYKNHRKIVFRARLGCTFQSKVIFTLGSLLVTYR